MYHTLIINYKTKFHLVSQTFVKIHFNLLYLTNLFAFNRQIMITKILHRPNNLKLSEDHFQVFKSNSISPYTPFINAQPS